jgi:hypothetical protein
VKLSAESHAFKAALVDRRNDQLGRDAGDRGEQFPQVIHIELGRRIVEHQACRRRTLSRLERKLAEDEGGSQQLLLTPRDAISRRCAFEEERHVCAMRPDGGRAQSLIARA